MSSSLRPGSFERPQDGIRWSPPWGIERSEGDLVGWQSSGGPLGHPARVLPQELVVTWSSPECPAASRISLFGVFALWAQPPRGKDRPGATIEVRLHGGERWTWPLRYRWHYYDSEVLTHRWDPAGDGITLQTVGEAAVNGRPHRVDRLDLVLPQTASVDSLRIFTQRGPASFVVFDALVEDAAPVLCPFHSESGVVALSDLGAIVRVGDGARFAQALDQLRRGVLTIGDLDEARGLALTFLAVVSAALLELGGSRALHRLQLDAARQMDSVGAPAEVMEITHRLLETHAWPLFSGSASTGARHIQRALEIVRGNFARDLCDAELASQVGLSTSHFRHLFRQVTGQPFHKYLTSLRLERARKMLVEGSMSVGEIALEVGFSNVSHFSRVFAERFGAPPSAIRRRATLANPSAPEVKGSSAATSA